MFSGLKLNKEANIKYIEIIFENLESIIVPIQQVYSLYVSGITSYLLYQSHFKDFVLSDKIGYKCEYAGITIGFNNISDLNYKQMNSEVLGMFINNETVNNTSDRPEVLGRIMWTNDISHLNFLDKNKESALYLAVPWGEHDYYNDCMTVKVDEKYKRLNIRFSKK